MVGLHVLESPVMFLVGLANSDSVVVLSRSDGVHFLAVLGAGGLSSRRSQHELDALVVDVSVFDGNGFEAVVFLLFEGNGLRSIESNDSTLVAQELEEIGVAALLAGNEYFFLVFLGESRNFLNEIKHEGRVFEDGVEATNENAFNTFFGVLHELLEAVVE